MICYNKFTLIQKKKRTIIFILPIKIYFNFLVRERSLSEPVSYFNAFNREEDRGKRYLVATVTRSPARRKRRDVDFTDTTGIIKLIVGNEACGNKYDASVPCNGPLQPGKQYR